VRRSFRAPVTVIADQPVRDLRQPARLMSTQVHNTVFGRHDVLIRART